MVVTSSVRLAGVLLVFSFLVVPAAVAALLAGGRGDTARHRLGGGRGGERGRPVRVVPNGICPPGATIVAAFGVALALTAVARGAGAAAAAVRRRGARALRPAAIVVGAAIALAGALLMALPGLDHVWLDAVEAVVPGAQEAFLTPSERSVRRGSLDAIARSEAMLDAAGALQQAARWGKCPLDETQRERIAQFLAGRRELAAGDRMCYGRFAPMPDSGSAGGWASRWSYSASPPARSRGVRAP